MFIDTHCHLFSEYYDSFDEVISNALNNHVNRFFLAGTNTTTNQEVIDLIEHYSSFYGCIGIHPEDVDNYSLEDLEFLEKSLSYPKIIGIGEIGLDYHYTKENKESQKALFEAQMQFASKYSLPVVIHSREATEDTISILKKYPNVKGVIHSFSGSLETAQIYIKMGYKLGINGVVTFKNSHLKEILPSIISSIVLETDSPYLTPHPYRGTRNEPKYIFDIASFLCEYCSISMDELANLTNKNIQEIFDI